MKLKKILAFAGITALATGALASCSGNDNAPTTNGGDKPAPASNTLTVWGPAGQQDVLKKLKDNFLKDNPDVKLDIKLGIMGEPDVLPQIQKDVTKAADVYAFPQNELENILAAGGLSQLGPKSVETVKALNGPKLVKAATAGDGNIYGYPETNDNGYFLFYDKSALSTTDVETFDGILKVAKKTKKNLVIDMGNAFYSAGFFFGTGCTFKVEYDENQKEKSVEIDFNSAKGEAAAHGILEIAKYRGQGFMSGNDDAVKAGFADGSVIAAVSGVWNAKDIKDTLKENLGAVKLPKFTADGKEYQMGSFSGSKLIGVNPTSKNLSVAHRFAAYITSDAAQEIRFDMTGVGPSATNVANMEKVQKDPILAALFAQNANATPEVSVPSTFWPNVGAFTGACVSEDKNTLITLENCKTKLDEMVAKVKAVVANK